MFTEGANEGSGADGNTGDKQYRVIEEVHLIFERGEEQFEDSVTLRRNRVEIERE